TLTLSLASTNVTDITAAVTLTFSVPQVVTLNYNIPIGTGYRLVVINGLVATTNTLGNSAAAITYPTTSGPIKLTGNVTALTGAPSTTANTTNIFHNLVF